MEKAANIQPLEDRRRRKVILQTERIKRMPHHPLHEKMAARTKNRLKRTSLNHKAKEIGKSYLELLNHNSIPEELLFVHWEPDSVTLNFSTSIPKLLSKDAEPNLVKKATTMEHLHYMFPEDRWIGNGDNHEFGSKIVHYAPRC
uniref:Uncharacterized protein n=1 Tax=Arion vulgaris TaxID=1028688 RepID=A0A0B7BTD2_9EUPU